jgi:hypothetical protein
LHQHWPSCRRVGPGIVGPGCACRGETPHFRHGWLGLRRFAGNARGL